MGTGNFKPKEDLKLFSNPIKGDKLSFILELTKKCICDIKCSKRGHGTGFICRIPYPDFFNLKPVLITSYHVLKKDELDEGKEIKFTLNNNEVEKVITITDKRKVYLNKEFDVTIIELDPSKDSIESESFLEVDKKIFCEEPNKEYEKKEIYIIGNVKEFT